MKTKIINKEGKAGKEIEMPKAFSGKIRNDILQKVFEVQKGVLKQAYGSKPGAGAQYSASGIIRHRRHVWKTGYGKGMSRVPRKIMSRHGSSFNWIGATVSSTRGGRRPHAPRAEKNLFKKINKKELLIAFISGFAGTMDKKAISAKFGVEAEGAVFSSEVLGLKTREFKKILENVFEGVKVWKEKKVRAGRGKMRGRKYKSNAGMLFVIASDEDMKRKGVDVVHVNDLMIHDLAPNGVAGRIVSYSENAIKEIGERFQ
jgi:large subunit ribosomal protein L4e